MNLRVPAGELGLASEDRLAYRVGARTTTGLPRSAPVRHDRGGCCLYSGAVVSALEPVRRSSPLLARSSPCQPSSRRPCVTEPRRQFTCVHPSDLPLARFARMVRVCLGLHPSAVARFVTWRLQGSGTGLDTIQSRDNESRLLNLVQSRVATNLLRCFRPEQVAHLRFVTSGDPTPLFSLRENAIAKEPGLRYAERWRCVSRLGASVVVQTLSSFPRRGL